LSGELAKKITTEAHALNVLSGMENFAISAIEPIIPGYRKG
jgi:hypothetical protein